MAKKIFILFFVFLLTGCGSKKEQLVIFHASTLAIPIKELSAEFHRLNPSVEIIAEASGSRDAARKVSELKRKADILALADYLVIKNLLMPVYAEWYINFARNRMVICFTEQAKYGNEISAVNWYEILSRKDVRFGRMNPDMSPLGYRTLMMWQLADLYYKETVNGKTIYEALNENCPPENIRPEELDLLPLLQNFTLDYCFDYISVAKQHNLKYITLPAEIDLSDPGFESFYKQAKVMLTDKKKGSFSTVYGIPIVYAVTVPVDAPHRKLALQFVAFMLSDAGQKIIEKNYQEVLSPALPSDISKIPLELRQYCGL